MRVVPILTARWRWRFFSFFLNFFIFFWPFRRAIEKSSYFSHFLSSFSHLFFLLCFIWREKEIKKNKRVSKQLVTCSSLPLCLMRTPTMGRSSVPLCYVNEQFGLRRETGAFSRSPVHLHIYRD